MISFVIDNCFSFVHMCRIEPKYLLGAIDPGICQKMGAPHITLGQEYVSFHFHSQGKVNYIQKLFSKLLLVRKKRPYPIIYDLNASYAE